MAEYSHENCGGRVEPRHTVGTYGSSFYCTDCEGYVKPVMVTVCR